MLRVSAFEYIYDVNRDFIKNIRISFVLATLQHFFFFNFRVTCL